MFIYILTNHLFVATYAQILCQAPSNGDYYKWLIPGEGCVFPVQPGDKCYVSCRGVTCTGGPCATPVLNYTQERRPQARNGKNNCDCAPALLSDGKNCYNHITCGENGQWSPDKIMCLVHDLSNNPFGYCSVAVIDGLAYGLGLGIPFVLVIIGIYYYCNCSARKSRNQPITPYDGYII